ncbi:MAG: prepilin-type N-terminal cleavage/methylation domain-containing protein [Deltaproteobacteria bacterium]|nr:prepilin-type N-terminal cleavage/methylation domain-containing protein [Deltaproteobacteria bacterium]
MLNGNNSKGFTLLELLIGMFVFTTSIISITAMLLASVKNNTLNYRINQVVSIAESKMEYFKNCGIDDLKQGDYQDPNNPINPDGSSDGIYNLKWKIADKTPFSKKIIVTVTDEKIGVNKPISLEASIFFD